VYNSFGVFSEVLRVSCFCDVMMGFGSLWCFVSLVCVGCFVGVVFVCL